MTRYSEVRLDGALIQNLGQRTARVDCRGLDRLLLFPDQAGQAVPLVSRRHAAPQMRASAPRNARACSGPDARQLRCSVLTTHPAPAIVRSRANLGAQGGSDFLSVVCPGAADRSARDREVRESDPTVVDLPVHR